MILKLTYDSGQQNLKDIIGEDITGICLSMIVNFDRLI